MHTECEEKRVLLNALSSTSNNIIEEMRAKGSPPGEITDQAMDIQQRFKTLCDSVKTCLGVWEREAGQFDSFLASLTSFSNWLNEVHSSFYDEVCIQIPSKATDDIIIRHKNKLEVSCGVWNTMLRTPSHSTMKHIVSFSQEHNIRMHLHVG